MLEWGFIDPKKSVLERKVKAMASKTSFSGGAQTPSPNWKIAEQDRELTVWQVALLSMGIDPSKKAEGIVKENEFLNEGYRERYLFLGKRLRDEPCVGYVHWLRNHAYNKRATATKFAMVDVVSCIDLLTDSKRFELAPEFVALREPLAKTVFYVPGRPTPDLIIMGSRPNDSNVAKTKEARDTSQSVENRLSDQRALQLFAIAVDAYCLKPNASAKEFDAIVDQVVEGLTAKGFTGNGLGPDAIKKSFKKGL
jgi:hypothetical protein